MSEKRHRINIFGNYQNKIVRNSPAFDSHDFHPRSTLTKRIEALGKRMHLSLVFDVTRIMSTQIRCQDL